MILSRVKPAIPKPTAGAEAPNSAGLQTKSMPKLEEFLYKRDYTGAMTLLEFNRSSGKGGDDVDMWLGYCAFHCGDYKRSMLEYEALTHAKKPPQDAYLNLACIFFYLGTFFRVNPEHIISHIKTILTNKFSSSFGTVKVLLALII
jgi:intraflagellar transport protein 56